MKSKLFVPVVVLLVFAAPAFAETYYVDNTAPGNSDSNNGLAMTTGGGSGPWQTLGRCSSKMVNGDTCYVVQGNYNVVFAPASGSSNSTRKTYVSGSGCAAHIRRLDLTNKTWITFDGFLLTDDGLTADSNPTITVTGSRGIRIINNCIRDTSTSTAAVRANPNNGLAKATLFHFGNNRAERIGKPYTGGGDTRNTIVQAFCDDCLFENNDFTLGSDSFLVFGARNIVRNNRIHDFDYKQVTTFGRSNHLDGVQSFCGGTPAVSWQKMLIEGNQHYNNNGPDDHFALINGTSTCGGSSNVIVRQNVVYSVGSAFYDSDNNANNGATRHKIYHNTVVNGGTAQNPKNKLSIANLNGTSNVSLVNNLFVDATRSAPDVPIYTLDSSGTSSADYNLAYFTTGTVTFVGPMLSEANGLQNVDPMFISNTGSYSTSDFHLTASSPAARSAGPLTTVAASDTGSGTSLVVSDAYFFQDGWGGGATNGVLKDEIAVGTSTNSVAIESIDYSTNTITLANSIARNVNDPVWLYKDSSGTRQLYSSRPDRGALQTDWRIAQQALFTIADSGGISAVSRGAGQSVTTGYASIQPGPGSAAPAGLAIFGFRQNNILVSEASVPAVPPILSGRIYAEVNGPLNTGLTIANPNNQPATVSFFFTDSSGDLGNGTATIPANGQIAGFLNDSPFYGPSSLDGTFTFSSSVPVAVVALRQLTNERSEFLITTIPVADLSAPVSTGPAVFPSFVNDGRWTTQIALVNPGDNDLIGSVQFVDEAGQPATVTVNGDSSTSFIYFIPPRSSWKLQSSGAPGDAPRGSMRVVPAANTDTPSGLVLFSFRNGGITVTEAGVPAIPEGTAFRLYAEVTGSVQTGITIANASTNATIVTLELTRLDGSSTGLTSTLSVPANGQTSLFLNEVQEFSSLQTPFQGVLRLWSPSFISVAGLRGRTNERGDFLIAATPPVNEDAAPSFSPIFFPHIVDSGGYSTQFILFSARPGSSPFGTIQFLSPDGTPLSLAIE